MCLEGSVLAARVQCNDSLARLLNQRPRPDQQAVETGHKPRHLVAVETGHNDSQLVQSGVETGHNDSEQQQWLEHRQQIGATLNRHVTRNSLSLSLSLSLCLSLYLSSDLVRSEREYC